MQDIGGCRIILSNLKNVDRLIKTLKKERLFELRNDYIRNPKEDGYKSIHLIGKFKNSEGELRSIELQIRTKVQHSWATAVEIVDLFTNQSLKSNSGKTIWKDFFKYTSHQFSLLENSIYLNSSDTRLIFKGFLEEFIIKLDDDLLLRRGVVDTFATLTDGVIEALHGRLVFFVGSLVHEV